MPRERGLTEEFVALDKLTFDGVSSCFVNWRANTKTLGRPAVRAFSGAALRASLVLLRSRVLRCLLLIPLLSPLGTESATAAMPSADIEPCLKVESHGWYQKRNSETVFVFVHGIFSNSEDAWSNKYKAGTTEMANTTGNAVNVANPEKVPSNPKQPDRRCSSFWPEIVDGDERLDHPSIYMGGYYAQKDSHLYGVPQAALDLYSEMDRDGVWDTKNIIFVTHSTGGLVVRQMLLLKQLDIQKHNLGLALFASPSLGSKYANMFSWVIGLYDNELAKELRMGDPGLDILDKEFRELQLKSYQGKGLNLQGYEYAEAEFFVHAWWLPPIAPIVSPESASRYFVGWARILPGTDHSSIVKPKNRNDISEEHLVDSYREFKGKFIDMPTVCKQDDLKPKFKEVPKYSQALVATCGAAGGNNCNGSPTVTDCVAVDSDQNEFEPETATIIEKSVSGDGNVWIIEPVGKKRVCARADASVTGAGKSSRAQGRIFVMQRVAQ